MADVLNADDILKEPVVIRFFQVMNILIFGVTSFVLCLVAMINRSKRMKRFGLVFLSLFALLGLLGLLKMVTQHPETDRLYTVFKVEFFMIATCVVFLAIKRTPKTNTTNESSLNTETPNNPFAKINHKTDF